ncbi:MAG: DUF177 domain-containing protein [Gammaproteobacteria bacterium]|nr:DUF177 domain-containing protein [Gammaproteobacteria bacterium]
MPRLASVVADTSGLASAKVHAKHDGGQITVQGKVEANLLLTCQRCFRKMEFPVNTDFNLAWVRNETEAMNLADVYEPLMSISGRVNIAELIEDELLLALPMVALHAAPQKCDLGVRDIAPPVAAEPEVDPPNPFAALEVLKRGRH